MASNESNLNVSISDQCNEIKSAINDWIKEQGGIVVVAQNVNEKVMTGYNNCIGPKALIVFVEETPLGESDVDELTGLVRRYFDIVVERPKIMSDPRNTDLTNRTAGVSKPLYDLVEECRDKIKSIIWSSPMVQNPCEFHGIRPGAQTDWLMNSYIISISTIVQTGREQVNPTQLGGGQGNDWIQLDGTIQNQNNP
jgi:hypothetical protein